MRSHSLKLTCALLTLHACVGNVYAIDSRWTGPEKGEWGNRNNWTSSGIPDNTTWQTFAVVLDSRSLGMNAEIEVTLRQNRIVSQLTTYGEVQLARRVPETLRLIVDAIEEDLDLTLTVLDSTHGLKNYGRLDFEDVMLNGTILNMSGAYLDGSSLDVYGGNIVNDGHLVCDEGFLDLHDGSLHNRGTVTCGGDQKGGVCAEEQLTNDGQIYLHDGSCSSGGVLINTQSGTIQGHGQIYSYTRINNQGVIRSLGGNLVLRGGPHSPQEEGYEWPTLENEGIIGNGVGTTLSVLMEVPEVNNVGTIEVKSAGAVVFDCNLVNEASARIKLLGGSLSAVSIIQKKDAICEGFGTICSHLQILPGGSITLTGPTQIMGDIEIAEDATLTIQAGLTLVTGRTTCHGTIRVQEGHFIPQGGLFGNSSTVLEASD